MTKPRNASENFDKLILKITGRHVGRNKKRQKEVIRKNIPTNKVLTMNFICIFHHDIHSNLLECRLRLTCPQFNLLIYHTVYSAYGSNSCCRGKNQAIERVRERQLERKS